MGRRGVGWVALGLLCLVEGTQWVLVQNVPAAAGDLRSGAVAALLCAVVFAAVGAGRRDVDGAFGGTAAWRAAVAGAMVLGGPLLGTMTGQLGWARHAGGTAAGLALGLTPVVAGVLTAMEVENGAAGAGQWPGLVGMAGLLLLLPLPALDGWSDMVLVVTVLLTGCGCVMMPRVAGGVWWVAAAACGGAAVVLGMMAVFVRAVTGVGSPDGFSWVAVASGLVVMGLAVASLVRVPAVGWTARFVLGPLVAAVEGVVLLRPDVGWRGWMGMGLLAVSGVMLVRAARSAGGGGREYAVGYGGLDVHRGGR